MENHAESTYKLIILCMLAKAGSPLTQEIISGFLVDYGYTNFFILQNSLSELFEEDFIDRNSTYNNTYYQLKNAGSDTFEMLLPNLSREIQTEIIEYLKKKEIEIRETDSTRTDFTRTPSGNYEAVCTLTENKEPLLSLTLSVPTEKDAIDVCNRFKEKKESIYQYLIRELL